MKSKNIIVVLMVIVSLVFSGVSFAQTGSSNPSATSTQQAKKLKKGEAEIEAIISKFQNFINRLDENADKLEEIIKKQNEQNIDTASSTAKLAIARTKITDAQKNLDTLAISLRKLIGAAKGSKKTFASIKTKAMKTEIAKIKEAHKALIAAMQSVKVKGINELSNNKNLGSQIKQEISNNIEDVKGKYLKCLDERLGVKKFDDLDKIADKCFSKRAVDEFKNFIAEIKSGKYNETEEEMINRFLAMIPRRESFKEIKVELDGTKATIRIELYSINEKNASGAGTITVVMIFENNEWKMDDESQKTQLKMGAPDKVIYFGNQ